MTSTGSVLLYDPTVPCANEPQQLRKHLGNLSGKVVGFIDNAKPNFDYLVEELEALLTSKYGVRSVIKRRKPAASMPAIDAVISELADQCDLVIAGSGD